MTKATHVRMMVLWIFAILRVCVAAANPVVLDEGHRPLVMLSENVLVAVGSGKSLVRGQFRFQQQPPFAGNDTHVTIFVPVLLPNWLDVARYVATSGAPHVQINGRGFATRQWNDLHLEGSPEEIRLPRGWRTETFVCHVPLRYLSPIFEATVTYTQIHFPNEIVAYVPIRPPSDQKLCQITFVSRTGDKLRLVSALSFMMPGRTTLQFAPKDRELLRVQSMNAQAQVVRRS